MDPPLVTFLFLLANVLASAKPNLIPKEKSWGKVHSTDGRGGFYGSRFGSLYSAQDFLDDFSSSAPPVSENIIDSRVPLGVARPPEIKSAIEYSEGQSWSKAYGFRHDHPLRTTPAFVPIVTERSQLGVIGVGREEQLEGVKGIEGIKSRENLHISSSASLSTETPAVTTFAPTITERSNIGIKGIKGFRNRPRIHHFGMKILQRTPRPTPVMTDDEPQSPQVPTLQPIKVTVVPNGNPSTLGIDSVVITSRTSQIPSFETFKGTKLQNGVKNDNSEMNMKRFFRRPIISTGAAAPVTVSGRPHILNFFPEIPELAPVQVTEQEGVQGTVVAQVPYMTTAYPGLQLNDVPNLTKLSEGESTEQPDTQQTDRTDIQQTIMSHHTTQYYNTKTVTEITAPSKESFLEVQTTLQPEPDNNQLTQYPLEKLIQQTKQSKVNQEKCPTCKSSSC